MYFKSHVTVLMDFSFGALVSCSTGGFFVSPLRFLTNPAAHCNNPPIPIMTPAILIGTAILLVLSRVPQHNGVKLKKLNQYQRICPIQEKYD